MHDRNYDKNDPRYAEYKELIDALEKKRVRFQTKLNSKLYSKDDDLLGAFRDIRWFFRKETGYDPEWLFNGISELMKKQGRPTLYTYDERILHSQFIDMLIQRGCSQNQAVNLLGVLKGMTVVTEGFKKEVRESYQEYLADDHVDKITGLLSMGETLSYMGQMPLFFLDSSPMHDFSLALIQDTNERIEKAVPCLRAICGDLLSYMKDNRALVAASDMAHPKVHSIVIKVMDRNHNDPLRCFFKDVVGKDVGFQEYCRQLREYLHTIDYVLKQEKEQKCA